MVKKVKFFISGVILTFAFLVCGLLIYGNAPVKAASVKTGTGLAEHALKAYQEKWQYSYGSYGQLRNGVRYSDCSGLIKSYFWWTGDNSNPNPSLASIPASSSAMLADASESGSISSLSSLPQIQGLILYSPGHVGVYIGDNVEVDNRCTGENIKCGNVVGGSYHWKTWLKLPQLSYPDTGFVDFNGNTYYYENGQYITGTMKTIKGKSYAFNQSGVMVSGSVSANEYYDSSCRTLQIGSRGSDVLQLQKDLVKVGCMSVSPTGYYGTVTQSAVKDFQELADMTVTGIADKKTQEAIYKSV